MKKKIKFLIRGKAFCFHTSLLLILLTTFACNISDSDPDKEKSNPNIVFIVADDLGYDDLSCYGATKIQTPAIDKLASEGISFSNAYVTSSLCSP